MNRARETMFLLLAETRREQAGTGQSPGCEKLRCPKILEATLCIIMAVIVYDHEIFYDFLKIYIITISLAVEEDEEF